MDKLMWLIIRYGLKREAHVLLRRIVLASVVLSPSCRSSAASGEAAGRRAPRDKLNRRRLPTPALAGPRAAVSAGCAPRKQTRSRGSAAVAWAKDVRRNWTELQGQSHPITAPQSRRVLRRVMIPFSAKPVRRLGRLESLGNHIPRGAGAPLEITRAQAIVQP